jgi:hypothetical protein
MGVMRRRMIAALAVAVRGRLVSRAAILACERKTGRKDVRLLVTIATPWGGHAAAAGAAGARVELPPSSRT